MPTNWLLSWLVTIEVLQWNIFQSSIGITEVVYHKPGMMKEVQLYASIPINCTKGNLKWFVLIIEYRA
jgi:hypothetical protein